MRFTAIVLLSLLGLQTSPANASNVCSYKWNDFQKRLQLSENRLAFNNPGGKLNIGVCWWHSRMQRNATYLLDFAPHRPKPAVREAQKMIKNLRKTNVVQTVPGFSNLREFSSTYKAEMTESLGQWQLTDTFFKLGWTRGVGPSKVTATTLADKIEALYQDVSLRKNITYQVLQMPGLKAHAWLVVDVKKHPDMSYTIKAIDSNSQEPQIYQFKKGPQQMSYTLGGRTYPGDEFVPYSQFQSVPATYTKTLQAYCAPRKLNL